MDKHFSNIESDIYFAAVYSWGDSSPFANITVSVLSLHFR